VTAVLAAGLALAAACRGASPAPDDASSALASRLSLLKLPPGFRIAVWADDLPDARSLAVSPSGTVFVGSRDAGVVRALRDTDGDGRADERHVLARGLEMPNGVAFRDGALYVAEISRISRFDDIEARLAAPPQPVVLRDDYPTDRHHGWKFIAFGPDGWLYVPVGAPCNVCAVQDPYASITRLSADGRTREIHARGVRNTVGFDWNPTTGDLWFTDNGRDLLGDDLPPDEVDRAPRAGLDFGFPRCHGRSVVDPAFGQPGACEASVAPEVELPAHVAALGLRFYTGAQLPAKYRGDAFVCLHGSWNRSVPDGYRVERLRFDGGRVVGREVFVSGWLQGERAWGRPVDVAQARDGSLLVSDDAAGAIYRIWWDGAAP